MAKRILGGAGVAMALIACVAAGTASAQTTQPTADEALPQGEVVYMAGNEHTALFLSLDRVRRDGAVVSFWVIGVNDPPAAREGSKPRVMTTLRYRLDCAARTDTFDWVGEFDEDGGLLTSAPVSRAPRPNGDGTPMSMVASIVCDGQQPDEKIPGGWRAALAKARTMMRGGQGT
jgi:hypothetical protein